MVMGTRAHETALYVVFESPFQMLADYPGAYEDRRNWSFCAPSRPPGTRPG